MTRTRQPRDEISRRDGPPSGPDDERRSAFVQAQALSLPLLVIGAWVAFSPIWFLPYPLTVRWRDSALWQSGPGLVVLVLAVNRYRAPLTAWRSAVLLVVLGAGLVALPFVAGWSGHGRVAVGWWNAVLSGAALTVASVIGVVQFVRRA